MERRATRLKGGPPTEDELQQLLFEEKGHWTKINRKLLEDGGPQAMDGGFFHDTRMPFIATDATAVTLSTTAKALYTAGWHPVLGGNYFGYVGKKVKIRLFGRITTVLTPGNGSFDIYYGTGADANGVILASSAALALTASQTNLSWVLDLTIECRSIGATGTLFCTGEAKFNNAVLASTLQPMLIPASAPAVSAACDLTNGALIISAQFKRSGSTVETMQVHQFDFTAMN